MKVTFSKFSIFDGIILYLQSALMHIQENSALKKFLLPISVVSDFWSHRRLYRES